MSDFLNPKCEIVAFVSVPKFEPFAFSRKAMKLDLFFQKGQP